MERIVLGSGKVYYKEFDGSAVPDVETIAVAENMLALISGGATLEYSPTYYQATDDLGLASKTVLVAENVKFKTGLCTWSGKSLKTLTATGRVTESKDSKKRTVKIGGVNNADGKRYVICFVHEDAQDGDISIRIVGKNQSGFSLAFTKDKETIVDAEFAAEPMDEEGTLIYYEEDDDTITADSPSMDG